MTLQTKDLVTFQIKAARRALGLSYGDVFSATKISVSTLARLESADIHTFPEHTDLITVHKLRLFFEERGIEFLPSNCIRLIPRDEQLIFRIKED